MTRYLTPATHMRAGPDPANDLYHLAKVFVPELVRRKQQQEVLGPYIVKKKKWK